MGTQRTALFVTDSRSSFRELAEIARLLHASGRWSCAICLASHGIAGDDELAARRAEGIACVDMLGERFVAPSANGGTHPFLQTLLSRLWAGPRRAWQQLRERLRPLVPELLVPRLRRVSASGFVAALRRAGSQVELRAHRALVRLAAPATRDAVFVRLLRTSGIAWQVQRRRLVLRWSRALTERIHPDLVVLCEDNVEGVSAPVVRAAREASAIVAILPNTIATAAEPAETYWASPAHSLDRWANRLVAILYPRWAHTHRGRTLLRLPAAGVLATEWLGLAPPLPWQINSGLADVILAESPAVQRYFARAGLPADRLRLTGTLSADHLARGIAEAATRRERLRETLGFSGDRPIVLCALPPNQLDVRASVCDFARYEDLLAFWTETLTESGECDVVLSLHPRSRREPVRTFEGPRMRIAEEPVVDLIPACDVFVASVSATIRWAIACSKPVLNYDVYRYHYDDYAGVGGVVTVDDRDAFVHEAARMLTDPDHRARLGRRQAAAAADWGVLDGRAGARILALFDELTR